MEGEGEGRQQVGQSSTPRHSYHTHDKHLGTPAYAIRAPTTGCCSLLLQLLPPGAHPAHHGLGLSL